MGASRLNSKNQIPNSKKIPRIKFQGLHSSLAAAGSAAAALQDLNRLSGGGITFVCRGKRLLTEFVHGFGQFLSLQFRKRGSPGLEQNKIRCRLRVALTFP